MPPLHSQGSPTSGAGSNIRTRPQQRETKSKWLPHPCLLGSPKQGQNATSPLHSRGFPTPSAGSNIRSSPKKRAGEIEVVASNLAFSRAETLSGIPNAKRGEQNKKCLPHPCLLGGPKRGRNATSPLHSRGSPTPRAGSNIRTPHQQRGTKSEVPTSPLPSRGPKTGPKCYVTPAFSGIRVLLSHPRGGGG